MPDDAFRGGIKSVAVSEESVGLGHYGKVLTILVAPELGSDREMDDDDEEESDLIESWTPRYRR